MWQWACREEDLPDVGDYRVYDVASASILVVRTAPGRIKAYHNACLHRATQLKVGEGNAPELRCPFHGWSWNLDGSLKTVPCRWDFPQVTDAGFALPECKVATWGGFVFVNMDPSAEPLEQFLETVVDHFESWPLEDRFAAVHVAKVMPANWKVTMEAFIESYHVVATHPQILPYTGDANTQYDVYRNHSRMITAFAVQSPHLGPDVDEQELADAILGRQTAAQGAAVEVPEGKTAREVVAQVTRRALTRRTGVDLSGISDSEALDAIEYFVFPNFMPWAGVGAPICYRFRPNGDDPDSSVMDVVLLSPVPEGERPPAAKVRFLRDDEKWTDAPELGGLGAIFEQDTSNLARIQRGLKASVKGVTLAEYQESRIRHFHAVLDRYLRA